MKQNIGFIGLGLMGEAMVEHLQKSGYPLTVLVNRSRRAIDDAVSRGAKEAQSARALALDSDIIMLCMDTSTSVESRMYGEEGIIAGLGTGKVVIDFGTSLPDSTRKLGAAVEQTGASMMDAPLGRTPAHAREGKLNIMSSGDQSAFDKVKEVLDVLGENIFYLGELGTGHTLKLINNFFGMTCACAMAEAFATAEKAGLNTQQLYDVMSSGPLHSGMMDFIAACALRDDPDQLQFSIRNARKDITYYSSMVDALGNLSVISPGTRQAFSVATGFGYGDKNVSEMVSFFRDVNKDR